MGYGFFRKAITDEQDAVDSMAKFLVNTIGWSLVEDRTDTSTDRRVVLSSTGEDEIGNPNLVYVELRGVSNYVSVSTYETYTDSVTYTGLLEDSSYGKVYCLNQNLLTCVADLERVTFTLQQAAGLTYVGYAGRITSYYKASEHQFPNLIKGMTSSTYDYLYPSAQRNMYMHRSDGTKGDYRALPISDSTDYPAYVPGARTNKTFFAALPVYYNLDASYYEIAGELRGIYHTSGQMYGYNAYYEFNGKVYVLINNSNSATENYIMGPIADSGSPIVENPYVYWNDPLV
jgi:hypothetical protein